MYILYRIRNTFMNKPTDPNTAIHVNKCCSVLEKTVQQQRWQPWLFNHKSCDILLDSLLLETESQFDFQRSWLGKKIEKLTWHFENIIKRKKQLNFSFKVPKPNSFSAFDFLVMKYSDRYYWTQIEGLPLPSSVGPRAAALCGQIVWSWTALQECLNCFDVWYVISFVLGTGTPFSEKGTRWGSHSCLRGILPTIPTSLSMWQSNWAQAWCTLMVKIMITALKKRNLRYAVRLVRRRGC